MDALISLLADARSKQNRWTLNCIKSFLDKFALLRPDLVIDWEEGDEFWVRVLRDQQIVGVISVEFPLSFFEETVACTAADCKMDGLPLLNTVADFDTPILSISRDEMESIFDKTLSSNIDYGKMSVNDLWWATVH